MTARRIKFYVGAALLFLISPVFAALPSSSPTLSVHESSYGTFTQGVRRESIQGITIRIFSHVAPSTPYEIQCFFLKRQKQGKLPKVNDTVIFNDTEAHGVYKVFAKPIKLSAGTQPSKSRGKSSKKSYYQLPKPSKKIASESPREGFVVRVLCDGVILRQHCSGYSVEKLAKEHPELFERAATEKSTRHLSAEELLKH
jgi:hypothetical protein